MTSSPNNDFERNVKSSLEGYEVPFNPSDWEAMEAKLDALPKSAPTFRFKWTFSMNVVVVILGCLGILTLVINAGSAVKESRKIYKSAANHNVNTQSEPKVNTSEPKSVANTGDNQAETKAMENIQQPGQNQASPAVAQQAVQNPQVKYADPNPNHTVVTGYTPTKNGNTSNVPTSLTPLNPELPNSGVKVFGDMIDPRQGFIYPTHEPGRDISTASQSGVHIGWNDYVLYDKETHKADTVKAQTISTGSENNSADTHASKKEKNRWFNFSKNKTPKDSNKESTVSAPAPDTAKPETDNKEETKAQPEVNKADAPADTVKKNRKPQKKAKYTGDRSIIDPY